jgi:RNase H-fold protein (predicted Holliday junction resolvase)
MRTYLAFDFGERRDGLANGNILNKTGQLLTTITYSNKDQFFEQIELPFLSGSQINWS